jgi:diguanylate cyclase (GGDEF)-like protein/PAS domain S-box-containing protein
MCGSEAKMSKTTGSGSNDEAAAQLEAIIGATEDGILALDADGLVTIWNSGAERLFGFTAGEMIGSDLQRIIPADHIEEHKEIATRLDDMHAISALDTVCLHKEGSLVDVSLCAAPIAPTTGGRMGATLIFRDITSQKTMENELARQSFEDSVTGLGNRHLLRERVEHAALRLSRRDAQFALLLLDLDDFKMINDGLGHAAGDELLAQVAQRISACVRPTDTVARLGGDEFAVLLEDMEDPEDATFAAERILDMLTGAIDIAGSPVVIHASIGIATSGPDVDADGMLRNADTAMYTAKGQGKNSIAIFEPGMHLAAVHRLSLKKDLQQAVDNGDFFLQYQPIVDLDTGAVSGAEALLRWKHATRGIVPPLEFIPLAEETGLIIQIGNVVLEQACRQAASWNAIHSGAPLRISVNVSTKQLHERPFAKQVSNILDSSSLDPNQLILEITESVFLEDTEDVTRVLHSLRETGASLAIDDFGTGYSSLNYLDKMPINILKIDRAFIRGLSRGPESAALAKAIIRLAQALELHTVAEGIELSEQVARLRTLHCNLGQGFYFAKPLDPSALKQILETEAFGFEWLDQWQPQSGQRVVSLAS